MVSGAGDLPVLNVVSMMVRRTVEMLHGVSHGRVILLLMVIGMNNQYFKLIQLVVFLMSLSLKDKLVIYIYI